MNMAEHAGRSLVSCPEAYSESLNSFISSLERINITLKCMKEHIAPLMTELLEEKRSPFCILSVGSGDGYNDLTFIEMLSKVWGVQTRNKERFFERAIEPDRKKLDAFRDKAESSDENLKGSFDFELLPLTYQEYLQQKEDTDVKFDVVHFFHSIYYVMDVETALEHCYEKELGEKGVILSITQDSNSPYVRYGKAFSPQGLIVSPGSYYSNAEVTDVARKNGWKYVECPGEITTCDITTIFDASSVDGNRLLDFLTQCVHIRQSANHESLKEVLNFWGKESYEDGGRKMVKFHTKTVMILKGL